MNSRLSSPLFVFLACLSLAGCDKPTPPVAETSVTAVPVMAETEAQLAEARDALQRQALEVETKTALMEKQLAGMEQALKESENTELRGSLDALKRQNDELREQADAARRQSNALSQRIAVTPRMNVAPQPSLPRDYSLFYERLAPFGRWFAVNGYGYCWRPTITTAGWRPYLDGCWVWSSLGWTWQSNEPYGWATYHYGRWMNLAGYGWVWVPGSEWAPAWVAWRQSRDCVGWAPLPPEPGICNGVYRDCDSRYGLGPTSYNFINTNRFVSPSYTSVCLPATQRTTVFQNSVNVTQIVRRDDHAHTNVFVHHGGPPRGQVEKVCARPVQQVHLQTTQANQLPPMRQGHHREDSMPQPMMVELPTSRPHAAEAKPEKVEHIGRPQRIDALEGLSKHAAAEIRATMAEDKAAALVQQQPVIVPPPVPAVVAIPSTPVVSHEHRRPAASSLPERESVRPAIAVNEQAPAEAVSGPILTPQAVEPPAPVAVIESKPVVAGDNAPAVVMAEASSNPSETNPLERNVILPVVAQAAEAVPPPVEVMKVEPSAPAAAVPGIEPLTAATAAPLVETPSPTPSVQPAMVLQPVKVDAPPPVDAEKMAAEQAAAADKARAMAVEQQTQAAVMQQQAEERQQAERMAAEQAIVAAETERARMQAAVQQQEQLAEQQRLATEQAAATAEAERNRQQAEAAAMQRQQEEAARRAAEEQQMRAQKEAEIRAQEMAQRQVEEAARRAAEEQQIRQQQEMVQRQAEEAARRQQEAEMQRAQEMAQRQAEEQARRAAEEQMRAQQEAALRAAQEMAQRQAEEAARRAQEEAQRAAAEAAQRAAAEAARNQAPPQNPGQ